MRPKSPFLGQVASFDLCNIAKSQTYSIKKLHEVKALISTIKIMYMIGLRCPHLIFMTSADRGLF